EGRHHHGEVARDTGLCVRRAGTIAQASPWSHVDADMPELREVAARKPSLDARMIAARHEHRTLLEQRLDVNPGPPFARADQHVDLGALQASRSNQRV